MLRGCCEDMRELGEEMLALHLPGSCWVTSWPVVEAQASALFTDTTVRQGATWRSQGWECAQKQETVLNLLPTSPPSRKLFSVLSEGEEGVE